MSTSPRPAAAFGVAAWVDDTAFDLLDDAGQVFVAWSLPVNKGYEPSGRHREPGRRHGWPVICTSLTVPTRIAVFDATSGKQTALCAGDAGGIG